MAHKEAVQCRVGHRQADAGELDAKLIERDVLARFP